MPRRRLGRRGSCASSRRPATQAKPSQSRHRKPLSNPQSHRRLMVDGQSGPRPLETKDRFGKYCNRAFLRPSPALASYPAASCRWAFVSDVQRPAMRASRHSRLHVFDTALYRRGIVPFRHRRDPWRRPNGFEMAWHGNRELGIKRMRYPRDDDVEKASLIITIIESAKDHRELSNSHRQIDSLHIHIIRT